MNAGGAARQDRIGDRAAVPTADATRLAVLIDADNSTASVTTELLEEAA
jgi:hypothetical protein